MSLLDSLSFEVATAEGPEDLRATTTMMRATLREIVTTAVEASTAIGRVRFGAMVEAVEVEEG